MAGVDLLDNGAEMSPVIGLLFDRRKLGETLWLCCEEAAATKGIDRTGFRTALDGDSLTNGWGAVVDAIVFFTPTQSREMVATSFEKQMEMLGEGLKVVAKVANGPEATQAIKKALANLETEITQSLPEALGNSATSSPASQE